MKPAKDHPLFIYEGKPGLFRKVLFYLQLITAPILIPIRIFSLIIIVYLFGAACWLVNYGTDYSKPLTGIRKKLEFLTFKVFDTLILLTLGIFYRIRGKVDKDAKLIIGNHTTLLDAFTGPIAVQSSPIAKKLDSLWPVRYMCLVSRALVFNRDYNKKNTHSNNLEIRDMVRNHIQDFDIPVILFPGGSIVDPRYNLKFKPFCFTLDQKMQIFTFRYHLLINIPWTCQSGWALALQHLMCWGGYVEMSFGPVVSRNIDAGETVEQFMDRVMGEFCSILGNERTEYTVDDVIKFFGMRQNRPVEHTEAYTRDFGWMRTYGEFCRRYKIGWLRKAFGVRSWMVEGIQPEE